jgi:hypothetical protein
LITLSTSSPDVAGLGQGGGVGHGEGDVQLAGQRLHEQGLAAAGGPDEEDVPLLDLDLAGLAVLADALVVVVDGDRERLLGPVLADDVLVQLLVDLARARVARDVRLLLPWR